MPIQPYPLWRESEDRLMARQQLPPQIKKVKVLDRRAGRTVVRYQVTVDAPPIDRRALSNEGVRLVDAVSSPDEALDSRITLVHHLHSVEDDAVETENAQRMLEENEERIQALHAQIRDARKALWGMHSNFDDAEAENDV